MGKPSKFPQEREIIYPEFIDNLGTDDQKRSSAFIIQPKKLARLGRHFR